MSRIGYRRMPALQVLTALLLYGTFHSLMAGIWWKTRVSTLVGERTFLGLYRLAYSLVSVVTLLPVLALMTAQPGHTVWNASGTTASVLLSLRVMAGFGLVLALLQIDGLRFVGVSEAIAFFLGREAPPSSGTPGHWRCLSPRAPSPVPVQHDRVVDEPGHDGVPARVHARHDGLLRCRIDP